MDSQGSSVRRHIALKLKDTSSSLQKITDESLKKGEDGDVLTVGSVAKSSLKCDHKLRLLGRPMKDPLMHVCEQCSLPVLIYGRMKRCRHAFCRDCAKKAGGVCPKCKESDQTFEEASMGCVYMCTYGGGRYDNKGCGRSYLSQRDLDAHILYRHSKDKPLAQQPSGTIPQTSVRNPISSFPLPPFFPAGVIRPPPSGLPPGFPTSALPPSATMSAPPRVLPQGAMVTMAPQFVTNATTNAQLTTGTLPVWTHPQMFK